ncbi:winged helix-turn-helix transcriptional regulator [Amycolatopsis sp. NBC_01480]|uniref:winged helix-turn-helix transcriptional regulator n=1 Tax=Amycolatopsis sp. NBC_01480 TaxID=2903562 RepID=UPI002E2D63D5|nr:helix-turn-helix domain-containing protein [Amycolatopsis sp. NBC_01480]
MTRYAQHCPVTGAAEVLEQPWTLLIIRELLHGGTTPPELADGLPGLSRGLLVKRLRQLADLGLVTLSRSGDTLRHCTLTEAGRALDTVVEALGRWGRRRLPPPRPDDLDPGFLLYDIARGIDLAQLPAAPVSVHFRFGETPGQRWWWLALSAEAATVTAEDPRLPIAAQVECTPSALASAWLGRTSWLDAVRDRTIRFTGSRDAVRSAVAWLGTSRYCEPAAPPW